MQSARPLLIALLAAGLALGGCAPAKKTTRTTKKPTTSQPQKATGKTPAKTPPTTAAKPAPKPAAKAAASAPPAAPVAVPAPAQAAAAPPKPEPKRTPQERYTEAVRLLKSNQWQDAEVALATSVKDYPQQSGPRTNLGILYARTNRKSEARAEFTRAVAANARNAVAHNWLGVLAREAGDFRGAETAYKKALQADPSYAPAQLNLAILYDQYLKRPQDALAAYRKYQTLAGSTDPRAAIWIAELEAQHRPQGAVK